MAVTDEGRYSIEVAFQMCREIEALGEHVGYARARDTVLAKRGWHPVRDKGRYRVIDGMYLANGFADDVELDRRRNARAIKDES